MDVVKVKLQAVWQLLRSAPKDVANFIYLHPIKLRQELVAVVSLLLIVLLQRWEVLIYFNTHILGGADLDAGLYRWLLRSNIYDFLSQPWFNTRSFFPYTRTLAWSDNFLLPAIIAAPLLWANLSLIAVWNLLMLGAQFLNGYCTYKLAARLSGHNTSAILTGTAFMSLPFFTSHLGHPQLQFAFWLPLGILALLRFLASPGLVRSVLVGLAVTACFLTTVYYAIFLLIGMGSIILAVFLVRPNQYTWQDYLLLLGGSALGLLPLAPFLLPYLEVRATFGSRFMYEAAAFAASGLSYFTSAPLNKLYGFTANWSHPEATLFPGLVVLLLPLAVFFRITETTWLRRLAYFALAALVSIVILTSLTPSTTWSIYGSTALLWLLLLVGIVMLFLLGHYERLLHFYLLSNRALAGVLLFTALIFLALSLGPLGNPAQGQPALGPYTLFYYYFPGVNSVRATSRFGVPALLCLILTIPFALSLLHTRRRARQPLAVLLTLLILLENLTHPYALEIPEPTSPAFAMANDLAAPGNAIVVIPFARDLKPNQTVASWSNFALLNVRAMHQLFPSGAYLVNGYSGQRSRIMLEYPRKLSSFPDLRSLNALGLISNLRYILYQSQYDQNFKPEHFTRALDQFSENLHLLHKDSQGNYLLEYYPHTRLADPFFLRVPSYPSGTVLLEIMAISKTSASTVPLQIFVRKHHEVEPWRVIELVPDGAWHQHKLSLPNTSDTVRPLLLTFTADENTQAYLRQRSWQPDHK